jgi:ABC-type phosphate/phosphonate transport system substrate-binding protein
VTSVDPEAFSALAMYPYPELQSAWGQLYGAVAAEVMDVPLDLRWDLDPHATWLSPQLSVGMACGWPLVTALRRRVRTVGTFAYEIDGVASHMYRSVIVSRTQESLPTLSGRTAAVNSTDSLSGHISLLATFGLGDAWNGDVVWTGAHLDSLDAVRDGRADVASIDALTWEYRRRARPDLLQGLVVVGRGPSVPCLPIIVNDRTSDGQLAEWRTAFAQAVRSPATTGAREALLIRDFVALDAVDYDKALADLLVHQPHS